MKGKLWIFGLLLVLLGKDMFAQQYVWIQRANFGGGGRYGSFVFSVGSKGYIGSGVGWSSGTYQYVYVDVWEYDHTTDAWTQKADFPSSCVLASTGFTIGSKGYVTTGWTPAQSDSTFEYDPATNLWAVKANFGGGARYTACGFTIDSVAYVGTGYNPLKKDFWKYDPVLDTWTQIADVGGQARQAASAFAIGNFGYVIAGAKQFQFYSQEVWRYDPDSNMWDQKANFPGAGRNGATAFEMGGKGFLGCGADAGGTFQDFWSYDPGTDTWTQLPDFDGGPRILGLAFTVAGKAFVGTGSSKIYPNIDLRDDLWEFLYTDANNVTGKLFIDFNNNSVQDSGEYSLPNMLISESNTGRFTFSKPDGSYSLAVLTSGSYTVGADSFGLFFPNPASHAVTFPGINQLDSMNDFAYQAASIINDLCVEISPQGAFRPGFNAYYKITYDNAGTTVIPGSIVMYLDTSLSFVSATLAPDSVSPDSILWDLGPINPFQSGSFTVKVLVDQTTPIGTPVTSNVRIDPIVGDDNIYCNFSSWTLNVTGSYDPNDILVNTEAYFDWQLPNLPALEYMIRFQNTGNDTAFNVDIHNTVPVNADIGTFEFVTSSHPVELRYVAEYNLLGFKFNDILLVDSNTNEPESHGFVRYRIKPKAGLMVGDSISNTAGIYFDFNAVVPTNTAVTKIISTVSVKPPALAANFSISPNPVSDNLVVHLRNALDHRITIYNTAGERVSSVQTAGKRVQVPLAGMARGLYIVQVESGGQVSAIRFVKE